MRGGWYPIRKGRKDSQDEVALAASAVLNGWILTQANRTDHCWLRNICELGYNGAVWGNIGEAVVEIMGAAISRQIARSDGEEADMLEAGSWGRERGRSRDKRAGCEQRWTKECPVADWNKIVRETRAGAWGLKGESDVMTQSD